MKKSCSKCGEVKPMDGFYKESKKLDGHKNVCKTCCLVTQKKQRSTSEYKKYKKVLDKNYVSKNRDKPDYKLRRKAARVKYMYGISLDEYNKYLETPCVICGGESEVLDHCHASGINRGGLCQACNKLLGCAKDKIDILKNAIKYLKEHSYESDR